MIIEYFLVVKSNNILVCRGISILFRVKSGPLGANNTTANQNAETKTSAKISSSEDTAGKMALFGRSSWDEK